MPATTPEIITSASIREHFQQSVSDALTHQQVSANDDTVYYVVNLLTAFARSEHLFDATDQGPDLKPLAFLYEEAVTTANPELRNRALRRMGDLALFISGMFADSLIRRSVDLDYFIAMGGNAYGHLSDVMRDNVLGRTYGSIFDELARKFTDFVDVLAEVGEATRHSTDTDILRLYEVWLHTGSRRAARRLHALGIHPSESAVSRARH